METTQKIEALKNALLLERRAQAFYGSVSGQSSDENIKGVFSHMAQEEGVHAKFIETHLRSLQETGSFADLDTYGDALGNVLDAKTRVDIITAGYEDAAILAAIALEEKAIAFYTEQEEKAAEPEEKQFFRWLSDWEQQHLAELQEMDNLLREKIWNDSNFWPF